MLCGSLATRELVLTTQMYPYHFRDSINVNNIDWVGDIHKRNIYNHAGALENIGVKVPNVLAVSLRNLYRFWVQLPEKMHIKMPEVLSLHIRSVHRRYTSTPVKMHIKPPQVLSLFIRSYLKKLFSYPLDDIFDIHIPKDIEITGTTKPHIRSPALSGSVIENEMLFTVDLKWQDESLTHTGYLLYKDTAPIGIDTDLEPIQEFDRYTSVYEDWDVEEDTTYYYRITPKSIYGRFFSNLLTVYVPFYLGAPKNFKVGFQNTSAPNESKGTSQTLEAVLNSGTQKIVFHLARVKSPYGAISQWYSLTVPGGIRTYVEEDREFTLFSGYLPPEGYPVSFDAYRMGDSVIPVFYRQAIPGDMTRFTIYERMFESREVTSGYRPPNGTDIRFSLFVGED